MALVAVERVLYDHPNIRLAFKCSTIDPGQDVNVTHTQAAFSPVNVDFIVKTRPTDGSDVKLEWDQTNDSAANKTIRIRFDTNSGGSLSGAVVDLIVDFAGAAAIVGAEQILVAVATGRSEQTNLFGWGLGLDSMGANVQ